MSINDMQYFSIEDRRAIFENNIIEHTISFIYLTIKISNTCLIRNLEREREGK